MASNGHWGALWLCVSMVASGASETLVGPGVGNADTFVSEGSKLCNKRQYAKASEQFLKATRANPALVQTYVQLARALMMANQPQRSCYAYRVYLKSVPDGPDRKKAAAESDLCERKIKGLKGEDLTKIFVDQRAAFFTALDARELLGPNSAADTLKGLVRDGFLGPELGEMAQKLGAVATAEAEGIHRSALAGEKLKPEVLRSARPLYQVAQEFGAAAGDAKGKMAFLDGLAELNEKAWKKAEGHFSEAAKSDSANKEYSFYRALALVEGGERGTALRVLEAELKGDPRTAVLRAAIAVSDSPSAGANELESLLFSTRFPPEK